jgi:hypothetical protein
MGHQICDGLIGTRINKSYFACIHIRDWIGFPCFEAPING